MRIYIKRLNDSAVIPTHGSPFAAGYDLHACFDDSIKIIHPHTTMKIGTGLAVAIPEGYFGAIFARSGLATKEGLRPANCVGVIDSDYRGEIIVAVHNDSMEGRFIRNGDRIAQLVILPFLPAEFEEVYNLDITTRGEGGFGSTGK